MNSEYLTVAEAAALLRVSTKTLYESVRNNSIPGAIRVGNQIRISRAALTAWSQGG